MFRLVQNQGYDAIELEDTFRSLFPNPQEIFNTEVFCSPCFPPKLLKDVTALYDVFVIDESAYSNMDETTKQNATAKLLLCLWFILFKRNNGKDMYEMLRSFYEANNLLFFRTTPVPMVEIHETKPKVLVEGAQTSTAAHQMTKISPASVYSKDSGQTSLCFFQNIDSTRRAMAVVNHFRDHFFTGDFC